MFTLKPIGYMRSPYRDSKQIPKGLGTRHDAEGVLELAHEFDPGLTDIEGFSHLFVIWMFHQSDGFELLGTPPFDDRPHGVFATRSPRRPNPIGLTVVELLSREGSRLLVRGVETCSTGRRSSTSSLTSPTFHQRSCGVGGWKRLKLVGDREPARLDDSLYPYPGLRVS